MKFAGGDGGMGGGEVRGQQIHFFSWYCYHQNKEKLGDRPAPPGNQSTVLVSARNLSGNFGTLKRANSK